MLNRIPGMDASSISRSSGGGGGRSSSSGGSRGGSFANVSRGGRGLGSGSSGGQILINGKAGILFKNNNYIDLSKKFINLIRDKKYLNKKIEYGYKKLYRFDYYHCLEKYFSILNKV